VQLIKEDVEKDGNDEIVLQNDELAVFIKPHDGGSIYEIDQKRSAYNILTVLTRRMEAYHDESAKIVQDRWRRTAFRDHFISPETSLNQMIDDTFQEWGDFTTATYEVVLCEAQNEIARTILAKQGSVMACKLNLTKEMVIKAGSREISINYSIEANPENLNPLHATFVPEINFIMTGDPKKVEAYIDSSAIDLFKNQVLFGKHFTSSDPGNGVTVKIQLEQETRFILIKLESKAKSELGWESLYQGTGLYPLIELNLSPGMKKEIQLKLIIEP